MRASLKGVVAGTVWSVAAALGGCSEGQLGQDGSDQGAGGRGGGGQGGAGQGGAAQRANGQAGGILGGVAPTGALLGNGGRGPASLPTSGNGGAAGGGTGAGGQACGVYGGDIQPGRDQDATTQRLLELADGVTLLQFTTVAAFPAQTPDLFVTVTDPAAARDAAQATVTLQVMPDGIYNCPNDWGVTYQLAFFDADPATGACPILFAAVDPGGCQTVTIGGGDDHVDRWAESPIGYWGRLATDLGVPVDALFAH